MLNQAATLLRTDMPAARLGFGGPPDVASERSSTRSDEEEYLSSEAEPESRSLASGQSSEFAPVDVESRGGFCVENKETLADDLRLLACLPELCDVTFLVGEEKQPVCGVRAILGARSRVFRQLLFSEHQLHQNGRDLARVSNKSKDGSDGTTNSKSRSRGKIFAKQSSSESSPPVQKASTGVAQYVIKEFEPEVFKQLIEYLHTGGCTLQARTLLGLINAADHYGLEELKQACLSFASRCINTDTVCPLLKSAERYVQYKPTKLIVRKVMEYIGDNAEVILGLRAFATLPKHVAQLILARSDLHASELSKFRAAHAWAKAFCDEHSYQSLSEVMTPLVENIAFHKIPAKELMHDVRPLNVVDNGRIVTALAYQADPKAVELSELTPPLRRGSPVRTSRPRHAAPLRQSDLA